MEPKTLELLDPQQQIAYDKVIAENGGIVWMNVGDGKTRIALLACEKIAWDSKIIVFITRRIAFYDLKLEVATLQLDADVIEREDVPLNSNFKNSCPTIVLVSEGQVSSYLFKTFMEAFEGKIGCIIVDEGYLYKNPKSDRHKALRPFVEKVPTIVLSGSIMTARDIVDIYGQVAIAGRAESLAPTLTKFRSKYQMGIQGNFYAWHPKPTAYKDIMAAIEPFTHIHMPDITSIKTVTKIYKVLPTKGQYAYFKELKETAAIDGKFELMYMSNIVTKAQQISDGWLKRDDGIYETFPSTKVERAIALVDELMQTTYKVVIWCAFRYDIERLTMELLHEGYKEAEIATWQSGKPFDIEKWKTKKCRICIATEAMGTSVNHFAQVPYAIYFSQDFKYYSLQQTKGRHTRRSSEHDTAYNLFLHTEKSLDAQVYWTVQASRRSEKSLIKAMEILQWLKNNFDED